jgi:hypothetical protein
MEFRLILMLFEHIKEKQCFQYYCTSHAHLTGNVNQGIVIPMLFKNKNHLYKIGRSCST